MNAAPPLLRLQGVEAVAGGRRLIEPSHVDLHEGERVLIVGASGSGKSLLCDLLLGFAGPHSPGLEVSGSVRLEGEEILGATPEARDGRLGAVFQLHALGLFDDLTVEQNLRFGHPDPEVAGAMAERLGIEHRHRRLADTSGGERMRIGIARTLLRDAGVLLYDEPTTGLDPRAIAQVVEAIETAHGRLSLVVTHDHASFADWADVILLLDPATRTLQRMPATLETRADVAARLAAPAAPQDMQAAPRRGWGARLAAWWTRAAEATAEVGACLVAVLATPWTLVRMAHPRDGPRIRQVLRRDLAPAVWLFVGLAAVLVAFTGTWFLFERLPLRAWSEPLVQEDLLAALGLISLRIGLPLMVSVLLAAKLGAAASAHLGHMSLTRQVDALRLLRVSGVRHLLLPTALGQWMAALVFTGLALVLGYVTSLLVFVGTHPGYSARWFHRGFLQQIDGGDIAWIVAKVSAASLAVAVVAYRVGTAPKRTPEQVIKGIHRTLLASLLAVLTIHALFAFAEF